MQSWVDEALSQQHEFTSGNEPDWMRPILVYIDTHSLYPDEAMDTSFKTLIYDLAQMQHIDWADRKKLVNDTVLNEAFEIKTNYDQAMMEYGLKENADPLITLPGEFQKQREDFANTLREFNDDFPFMLDYEDVKSTLPLLDADGVYSDALEFDSMELTGSHEYEVPELERTPEGLFDRDVREIVKELVENPHHDDKLINQVLRDEIEDIEIGFDTPEHLIEALKYAEDHDVRIDGDTWRDFDELDLPQEVTQPLGEYGKRYADAVRADARIAKGEEVTTNQTRVDYALEHGVDFSRDIDANAQMQRELYEQLQRDAASAELDVIDGKVIEEDYDQKPLQTLAPAFEEFLSQHGRNVDGSKKVEEVETEPEVDEKSIDDGPDF